VAGHVFIVQGDLTRLRCDAWLLPSDAELRLTAAWREARPDLEERVRALEPPAEWQVLPVPVEDDRPQPWVGDVPGEEAPAEAFAAVAAAFVRAAAPGEACPPRERRLLGVPVLGTGQGGGEAIKGEVVDALLRALHEAAAEHEADVVLVTRTPAAYTAAQSVRARLADELGTWREVEPWREAAASLAEEARRGELVVFLGGGVSAGAGLPVLADLLARLEDEAGLGEAERAEAQRLNLLDRGRLLERRLGGPDALAGLIARWFDRDLSSLIHLQLATLPVQEAATMNYDRLFELAAEGTGRPVAVLPYEPAGARGGRWLLKLHGTLTDDGEARDIVLTRDDYLSYEERRAALAGIVQALLITRHMLFVGFSLADDNFHRIVHEVRTAVGASDLRPDPEPFATALTLERAPLAEELWEGDLRVISLAGEDPVELPAAARRLEIFLDLVLALATDAGAHLLDASFAGVLGEEERELGRVLRGLEAQLREAGLGADGPAAPVHELLRRLGATGDGRA